MQFQQFDLNLTGTPEGGAGPKNLETLRMIVGDDPINPELVLGRSESGVATLGAPASERSERDSQS